MAQREEDNTLTYEEFKDRLWLTLGVVTLGAIVLMLVFFAAQVLIMAFIGIILALFFGGLAEVVANRTPVKKNIALIGVLVVLAGVVAAFVLLAGPQVSSQFSQLFEQLPSSTEPIRNWLDQYGWGQTLLEQLPDSQQVTSFLLSGSVTSSATRFITSLVGIITGLILVLFLGIFLAFQSGPYVDGLLHLFPLASRERMGEVFYAVGEKLKGWIAGRGLAMVLVGVGITIGLSLLGVPLAMALGVLAGVLTFIPNWGPTIAAIPAALLALTQSPQQALAVIALYAGAQLLLQYAVNPLILKNYSNLPAAIVIMMQVLMTVLFGVLGLMVAAPLVAVGMVMIKMLYVEDVLGDDVKIPIEGVG